MQAETKYHQLDKDLTLHDCTQSSFFIHVPNLSLIKLDDNIIECRLIFRVSPEIYQQIEAEALFNLNSEVRTPFSSDKFLPDYDIKIEATLKPDLLPKLIEHAADANEAATYILNLREQQPDSPLLSTKSWLGLSVSQMQESGETGYRTFWSYVSPSVFSQAATPNEQINNAITNFFKDWTEANLSAVTQKATSEFLEGMTSLFKELADEIPNALDQEVRTEVKSPATHGQIFEGIINFFQQDDWSFAQVKGEPVLQMAFQGKNGKWTCYARAREEQGQFVFYSICPINTPENKHIAIAEFLTRANSGVILGNFELDFADGEIRYKTSIDVEGDRLSSALIKRLVYANVTMMDEYLPGIMSVIYGDVEPKDAIR